MNSFKKTSVTLLTGLFLIAGAGLFAEPMGEDDSGFGPGPRGGQSQREERFEEMNKELGLSKEQIEKLRAHRQSQRQTNQALFQQIREKREALRAELEGETVNTNKAKALNDELKALHQKMADQRLSGVLEVRKILTAEQFKKLREIGENRRAERRGGLGGGSRGFRRENRRSE